MVECSKVDVKLTNKQLKKLKTAAKNNPGTIFRMNLKMFDGNDLPHDLLLTTRPRIKLRNAFNNHMSTYIKPSKTQISKIIQSWVFLGSSLIKSADPLMKVAVLLAINILGPIGITAATSETETGIQKKIHGSGVTTLI